LAIVDKVAAEKPKILSSLGALYIEVESLVNIDTELFEVFNGKLKKNVYI
jgi:hypothetical protein